MSPILSLHRTILVNILADWIEINDLAFLDSAISRREFWLQLILSPSFSCFSTFGKQSKIYFEWLVLRRIRVKDFDLRLFRNRKLPQAVLQVLGNTTSIRSLVGSGGSTLDKFLSAFKGTIESLDMSTSLDMTTINLLSSLVRRGE